MDTQEKLARLMGDFALSAKQIMIEDKGVLARQLESDDFFDQLDGLLLDTEIAISLYCNDKPPRPEAALQAAKSALAKIEREIS